MIEFLIATAGGLVGLVSSFIVLYKNMNDTRKHLRRKTTIIGIPCGQDVPPGLLKLSDFTSLKKAINSDERVVVLHTRTLSYALRKADFVCIDDASKTDPKIRMSSDKIWDEIGV